MKNHVNSDKITLPKNVFIYVRRIFFLNLFIFILRVKKILKIMIIHITNMRLKQI